MTTTSPQTQPAYGTFPYLERDKPGQIPTTLFILASAYVISAIAISNIPGWNFSVRIIAALYVLTHLLFILFRRVEFIKPNSVHYIFVAWSFLSLVGGNDTVSIVSLFGKFWTVLQLICLSYFLYALAIEMKSIRWLEWNYLIGSFVSVSWIFITTGGHFGSERISGLQGNANLLACVLLMGCVLSLDLLRHYRSIIIKGALMCNIGIIFPFILATGSRKGIIGFFLLVCFEAVHRLFLQRRGKRVGSVVFGVLGILLALTVCLPMLTESPFFGRMQNLERFTKGKTLVERENSLAGRVVLYKRGIELAIERPFFGLGLDQFRFYDSALRATTVDQTYSHSNVIEILADTGFLGFVIYHSAYVLIVLRLLYAWKRSNSSLEEGYSYLCAMIGLIVILFDLFSVTYYLKEYWLTLTILVCAAEFTTHKSTQGIQRLRSP